MKRRIETHTLKAEGIQRIAEGIYIFGYPLLLMDVMRRIQTTALSPTEHAAPPNQFAHERFLTGHGETYGVHPIADCLRSSAWLDLSKEPVMLSIPRCDRYYLLSCFSGWYEIFVTNSPRKTGVQGGDFAFVGPGWRGTLPDGVQRIDAPTETVWIDGRLEVDGPEDIDIVHRIQDQIRLTTLTGRDSPAVSQLLPVQTGVDPKIPPEEQVARFDARKSYTRLARLMQRNPAQESDAEIVAEFARIGFHPSEDFTFDVLPPGTADVMQTAVTAAQTRIANASKNEESRKFINGWSLHIHPGFYLGQYLERAVAANTRRADALAEDVLSFHTCVDIAGEPLDGAHRYVINFPRDLIPPVNALWSITLYDTRQHLVRNDIRRNVIGGRNRLRLNADNSVSVHIQHDWPGTMTDSNWLPAPKRRFSLELRMYWPKLDAITGNWRPPAVMRAN